MDNLVLYNKVRAVPDEAKKKIGGGRLSGMTDINPMWRLKKLTEEFGICGVGWYTEITKQWMESGANGELAAFCNINLFIKSGDDWSKPIGGTGGAMFVAKEKNGLFTSDECLKMAYTDAISVACKALGFGADVYFEKDKSKYDTAPPPENFPSPKVGISHIDILMALCEECGWSNKKLLLNASKLCGCSFEKVEDMTIAHFEKVADYLRGKVKQLELESQNQGTNDRAG